MKLVRSIREFRIGDERFLACAELMAFYAAVFLQQGAFKRKPVAQTSPRNSISAEDGKALFLASGFGTRMSLLTLETYCKPPTIVPIAREISYLLDFSLASARETGFEHWEVAVSPYHAAVERVVSDYPGVNVRITPTLTKEGALRKAYLSARPDSAVVRLTTDAYVTTRGLAHVWKIFRELKDSQ